MLKSCYLKEIIQTSNFYWDQRKILVPKDDHITKGREGGGLGLNGILKDKIIQFVNQN